jgi:hypothetical protein
MNGETSARREQFSIRQGRARSTKFPLEDVTMSDEAMEPGTPPLNRANAPQDPMEQVRDLLFGDAQRSTERQFRAMDEKIEAMRRDFLERFTLLESLLDDLARETENSRMASVDAIGSAIAQLGATVQNLSARRKDG